MNAIDTSLSNYGLIGTVGSSASALTRSEAGLTAQATSGLISTGLTGLGGATKQVLDLQPQFARLGALSSNATLAGTRLQTAQTALTAISSMAGTLAADLAQLATQNGSSIGTSVTSLAGTATSDLGALASALNTTSGDAYVFAGTAETTPPVANPSAITTGALSASVATAINSLSTQGATATLSSIISAVGSNSVFSANLDGSPVPASIDVGFEETAVVGLPATSGLGMSGASATSTGSGINDFIAVVSALSQLSPAAGGDPQFPALVSGLQAMLGGAQGGLSAMISTLGVSQQQVTAATTTNASMSDALGTQIGSLTTVDLPTVATQLTDTQNQLMASYEIISDLKGMTLAAYL